MAYSVRKLITNSFYLSGIVSKSLTSVSGRQLAEGEDLLNDILSTQSINLGLIPYYKSYSLDAVIGQEEYFIPNLVQAETFTFYIGTVRYSVLKAARDAYFGAPRADNVKSLPFAWHVERCKGGSNLFVYFKPASEYPLVIWGKFGLDEIDSLDTDLEPIYDRFYIKYLRYLLAEAICDEYKMTMHPQAASKLKQIQKQLRDVGPADLTIKKLSTLSGSSTINYADINLGNGWRPI